MAALFGFIAILVIGGLFAYGVIIFNGLIALRNETKRAWANVDVLLKQRHDEVPNLVATVQGYAAHERTLFDSITKARAAALAAPTRGARVAAEAELGAGITRLLAVGEAYPDLKANASFLALQRRVTELEGEIADRRELYNNAVTNLHNRIATFPDTLIASMTGQTQREALFEAAGGDRDVVAVDLAPRS